ncbi:30S ribosomal protein S5 [Candidatus Woesearchaeota archaeon]|nr:30S ribosomal protein S5 [Candidatus Woesearchaeota archaeon]
MKEEKVEEEKKEELKEKEVTEDVPVEKIKIDEKAPIEAVVEKPKSPKRDNKRRTTNTVDLSTWEPKTSIGKQVKIGEIKDIDEILDKGIKIMESEIVDTLLPDLESELLLIGQSKGKFGGGQRRVFRQTQKKTREGNKPRFSTIAVIGNKNGYVGVGYGKSKETVPAREKATRQAKLNIKKIRRGSGTWESTAVEPNSIPFKVEGKCGSVEIILMPAPKGIGLCVEKECAKILKMAGVKDIWSKTKGQTKNKINLINALMIALDNLMTTKVKHVDYEKLSIVEGKIKE